MTNQKINHYILTAKEIKPLKTEVMAKNEQDALKQLEEMLDNGEMPEGNIGYISDKRAVKISNF